jgi:hypothetical protein
MTDWELTTRMWLAGYQVAYLQAPRMNKDTGGPPGTLKVGDAQPAARKHAPSPLPRRPRTRTHARTHAPTHATQPRTHPPTHPPTHAHARTFSHTTFPHQLKRRVCRRSVSGRTCTGPLFDHCYLTTTCTRAQVETSERCRGKQGRLAPVYWERWGVRGPAGLGPDRA